MKYFLIENEEKAGPFTLEELSKKSLSRDSLVWSRGLDDWTEAKDIPMLKDILAEIPPIYKKAAPDNPPPLPTPSPNAPATPYFGYQLATRWERFLASLVGGLIVMVPVLILTKGDYLTGESYFSFYNFVVDIIIAIVLGGLFYALWSGNLGHKIFGLKVISKEDGKDVNNAFSGATREVMKSVLAYLLLPLIWLLWDKDRQNLYDKMVSTIVVKKKGM